ncbi:MAG: hypothetical protein M1830_001663 [Pleopsidium flavum]|nr:MAG: hypothetical protein M1830_001663 [Pleopsidium flavum]
MATLAPLGNLVRLLPLQLSELPAHPALAKLDQTAESDNRGARDCINGTYPEGDESVQHGNIIDAHQERSADYSGYSEHQNQDRSSYRGLDQKSRPRLISFIKEILDQATSFVDDSLSNTFAEDKEKSSSPAVAKVRLLKRNIDGQQLSRIPWSTSKVPRKIPLHTAHTGEAWFARRSHHANHVQIGTADFSEFEQGLMVDHSKHEQEYTPDVFDAFPVLNWDAETLSNALTIGEFYSQIRMCIYEMCHKLPWPLSPRVFPVLVVTAKTDRSGFIVVQIPASVESLPDSFYSNGRNLHEGDSALKKKRPVLGVYTSIERCRILPDLKIEWIMATASDAKGWLPMWAQKLGVPSAVVKDVGLFIKWVEQHRQSTSSEAPPRHNYQTYQSNTGTSLEQQLGSQHSADTYHYQDFCAVPSPVPAYNGPASQAQNHWGDTPQLAQNYPQQWQLSPPPPSAPPASHIPATNYNPNTYGLMPSVQQSPVRTAQYHAGRGSDTSTWGVTYKENHEYGLDQGAKPPLPFPPRDSNPHQHQSPYNVSTFNHVQDPALQYPPPPLPPPKLPQGYQDDARHDQQRQPQHATYPNQAVYRPNLQQQFHYLQTPVQDQYYLSSDSQPSALSPASQHSGTSYPLTAPYSNYQVQVQSSPVQPSYPYPTATLSQWDIDRRSKWASVVDQPNPPVVSPPLPEHSVLAYHQESQVSPSSAPVAPSATLVWSHGPQLQQLHHQPDAHGWRQGTTVHAHFSHQKCDNCGHQKSDQARCEECNYVDRGHERWQHMQEHTDSSVQHYSSYQLQQHITPTQASETNQQHAPPQDLNVKAVSPEVVPDVRRATPTGALSARASVNFSSASVASALGHGGPSDWEHFGGFTEEEIDDTELFSRKEDVVTTSVNDSIELPSHSAPPLHRKEQIQMSQTNVGSEEGPATSAQMPQQPCSPPSVASHLSQQIGLPPPTATRSVVTPSSTHKLTPESLTPTESIDTVKSRPAHHPQQESVDGTVQVWSENRTVSTGEGISGQTTAGMPTQNHTIDHGDRLQKQLLYQSPTPDLPRRVDLRQLRTHSTSKIRPSIEPGRDDVADGEEASIEGQQYLLMAGSLASKPLQKSEKIGIRQFQTPDEPYSDLDPWAKASLTRYIAMLRAEARASTDIEKLHIFTTFMTKESLLRTVLYEATPDVSADAIWRLGQPSPEVAGAKDVNSKLADDDVLIASSQAGSMPPPQTDAPLSQYDIPPPSPKDDSAPMETSDSSARAPSLAASTKLERESSAHVIDPLLPTKDCMPLIGRESLQTEKQSLPQSTPSKREPISSQELTPPRAQSARGPGIKAREEGVSTIMRSTTESYSTDSEDDVQYSPGGRPIVMRPDRDQPRDRQNVVPLSPEALPSQKAIEQASTAQPHADSESHSPGTDAPIVIDAAWDNTIATTPRSTSVPSAFDNNTRRTSSPGLPEVAHGRPAYTPFRYTEAFAQGSGLPASAPSNYKAYPAPRQTSLDSGISMRSMSPIRTRRDTIDPIMSRRCVHDETFVGDASVIRDHGNFMNKHSDLFENNGNILNSSRSQTTGNARRASMSQITCQASEAHITSELREAVAALRTMLPAGRDDAPASVNNAQIAAAQNSIDNMQDDFSFIKKTVVAWDAQAKKIRGKHERERQLRQEQSEERIDGLFHDNEIGYSDISALEAEFKKVEAEKRALEEEEEHQSFVRSVYEVVTDRVQQDIDHLSGQYNSLMDLLVNAVACKDTFKSEAHRPEILQVLEVILILHSKLEIRHRKAFEALIERDRRLRKTKLAPLYTEGRITEMKQVEKRLDNIERDAILEATRRRDERATELVRIVDEHIPRGIADNQDCMKVILREVRTIGEAVSVDSHIDDLKDLPTDLAQAHSLFIYLLANSMRLTQQSHAADLILNDANYDVLIAEARAADAGAETFERMREEKDKEDVKLKQELEQRDLKVKKDFGIADEQVKALLTKVKDLSSGNGTRERRQVSGGTELEPEGRIQRALEEAKKRNAENQSRVDRVS